MDIKTFLTKYGLRADEFLDEFFLDKKKKAKKISPIAVQMLDLYREHLRGGKKARGALMVLGYQLAGGKEGKKILKASLFLEIMHSFLLIHDDVMDKALLRRGRATPEVFYQKLSKKKNFSGDQKHFALSMTIDLGDLGVFLAQEALTESGFSKEKLFDCQREANLIYQKVAFGQALDIFGEKQGQFDENYVLKIHQLKTADYSVSGPLRLGAILAGAPKELLGNLTDYGLKLGIAFQIQDDYLGVFGDEKTLGKEIGSDIKEGKATLLILRAKKGASQKQRDFLKRTYGKNNLSRKEIDQVRIIFQETGADRFSLERAEKLTKEAKKSINKITKDKQKRVLLEQLADYMIKRNK